MKPAYEKLEYCEKFFIAVSHTYNHHNYNKQRLEISHFACNEYII